jgi:hypothetical protein
VSSAGNSGPLAHAIDQGIRYDSRSDPDYQAECLRFACRDAGCDVADSRRWASNRNADLFLIDSGGARRLLKIQVSKPREVLECEYRSLEALDRLAGTTNAFSVPRPLGWIEGRSAYAMEFVEGQTLDARLRLAGDPRRCLDTLRACGRAFGTIHREWATGPARFDSCAMREDLRHLPWRSSAVERSALERALRRLDGRELSTARLYLDCDPVNVLVADGGAIVLIDSPEREASDVVEWDLGAFLFGLRRLAWKRPWSAARLRGASGLMRGAFLEGYAGASPERGGCVDPLLLALGEWIRLAQLWAWWLRPMGFRHRVAGFARALYAYPLLLRARAGLIREINALAGSDGDD